MQRISLLIAGTAAILSILAADILQAQPSRRRFGTIECQATIDEIPRHPLGLTNRIGDIELSCTNDGIVPQGAPAEFRTHFTIDVMVSLNANITNRIDFGEGEDVTDVVLAFGGDEDVARVDSVLGSSIDPRFPRPQYGRLAMSSGQLTETGKRLGLAPRLQGAGDGTIIFFDDVNLPLPFTPNTDYPRCMSHRADDPNGCMPATIDALIRNVQTSSRRASAEEIFAHELGVTLGGTSERVQFAPSAQELNQVCRPRPAAIPGACSGPPPATGERACGTFWFFDPSDQANFDLCIKVLDGTTVNDRFWVFYGATTNVEFTLTVDDVATGPRPVFNPNPDGTGGQVETGGGTFTDGDFGAGQALFETGPDHDIKFGYEISGPTLEDLEGFDFLIGPAPTSDILAASSDAPKVRYLGIAGLLPDQQEELNGACPSVNLLSGEPSCGPSIRAITDISFIQGDLVQNGFFSVFVAGAPAETFAAGSLPLGQDGPIRIKITQDSVTVEALDVFSDGSQYNGIIPKDAPVGEVEIRVCIGDEESAPFPAVIAEKKPRLFTLDGFGSGMGVFHKFDEQRLQSVPLFTDGFESGDITAWGSGLGTSPSRSDRDASPAENFAETNNVEVRIGGVPAQSTLYAGPNPQFPALDQYNIVPAPDTPPGCFVPLDIVVNDCPPSNFVGLPVSPNGGACEDPLNPYLEGPQAWPRESFDVQLLQALVTIPAADGGRSTVRVEQGRIEAGRYSFTSVNLGVSYPSLGTCTAINGAGTNQDDVFRRPPPESLNTGGFRLTRLSPNQTVDFDETDPGVHSWSLQLDPESDPFFVFNGDYALQHAAGQAADIPSFDFRFRVGFRFGGPPSPNQVDGPNQGASSPTFWTNQDGFGRKTVIGKDVVVEWDASGMDPLTTAVSIAGISLGDNQVGGFLCTADPTLGTFTVPGRLTANVPPTREPNRSTPLGALAVGTIGTKQGRIPIDSLQQQGTRAYIDFQQREVISTIYDTCALTTCP